MLAAYIVYSIVFGALTALAAQSRGREVFPWFLLGLLFGVFGLIAVLVMSKEVMPENITPSSAQSLAGQSQTKKCPDCAEEIKIEAKVCRFCGKRFDTHPDIPEPQVPPPTLRSQPSKNTRGPRTERCQKCYTMNYDTDRTCASCGAPL